MFFSFPEKQEGYTEILVSRFEKSPPILKLRAIELLNGRTFKARVRDGQTGHLIQDYYFSFHSCEAALDKAYSMAKDILKEKLLD